MREPDPYQVDGINFLYGRRRSILGDDVGLGKTAQALLAGQRVSIHGPHLIITKRTIKARWLDELLPQDSNEQWFEVDPYDVYVVDKYTNYDVSKSRAAQYTILHYACLAPNVQDLLTINWKTFTVDEAHEFRNGTEVKLDKAKGATTRKGKMYEAFKQLTLKYKDAEVFFLTATSILKHPADLWPLLQIVDRRKFSSYWRWAGEHLEVYEEEQWRKTKDGAKPFPIKKVGGPKNIEEFRRHLEPHFMARSKEQLGLSRELPPVDLAVTLEGEQERAYRSMYKSMYAEIKGGADEVGAGNSVTQHLRLRQILISPDLLDGDSNDLRGAKIDALLEILEGAGEQKAIVFSMFSECIRRLALRLQKEGYKTASFWGKHSDKQREQQRKQFQEDSDTRVLLTTIKEGYDAYAASLVFIIDRDWLPLMDDQAVGRANRRGQKGWVTRYDFTVTGTIDIKIKEKLLERRYYSEGLPTTVVDDIIRSNPTGIF